MTMKLALLSFLISLNAAGVRAQEKIVVPLRLNQEFEQFSGQVIVSRLNDEKMIYTSPAGDGLGHAPGKVLFRVEPLDEPPNSYRLTIDTNSDGDLSNDTPQTFAPNSSLVVKINRKWANGKQLVLPYSIKYSRSENARRQMREDFRFSPHYRAEGRLKIGKCENLFAFRDLNNDGQFDVKDLDMGSSIGLDRDGDGRTSGKDEVLLGNQIIEYCGESFLVDSLAADGSSITLVKTALRVPKIGEKLPEFSLPTTDGQTIESSDLRNKIYLLDFWASYCKPCVEKFGHVKQIAGEFKADLLVIAINVDEEASLSNAREIIKSYGLTWPHVMRGRGDADPLWKMFGGMEQNRLAIPLYVVVDAEGRLRYAANGGEDLAELRKTIKSLVK
jgi:peroxiredoxin